MKAVADIKKLVDARIAARRQSRLNVIHLAGGFDLKRDGTKLIICHETAPEKSEVCGSVAPDGEWQLWPVWYEVIAEELGPTPLLEEEEVA